MKAVGVFDSGVGGLTVVKELIKQLPYEDIVYFGDTARVPYGIKSKETVIRFSIENILFLLKQEVKLICVACNTVSSLALPVIRSYFKVPIVGVLIPGARGAVNATENKRVGIIGTKSTVKSRAYEHQIKQLDPKISVTAVACPLLVPFAEEGYLSGEVVMKVAGEYLKPLKKAGVDTVILGCTHYPLLKPVLKEVLGGGIRLIDSAKQVAIEVKKLLDSRGMLNKARRSKHKFYVSDNLEGFSVLARAFLGRNISDLRKVNNL